MMKQTLVETSTSQINFSKGELTFDAVSLRSMEKM